MAFQDSVCTYGIGFEEPNIDSLTQQHDSSLWVAEAKKETACEFSAKQKHVAAVASARARARIVLERFQKQRSILNVPSKRVIASDLIGEEKLRRQKWLDRETNRIRDALLKNLDSLLEHDRANLAHLNSQLSSATDVEQATSSQYDALLERRRAKLLGVVPAKGQPKKPRSHQKESFSTSSVPNNGAAVYISGLGASDNEAMLRSLFGAFGQVKHIHFYRDKDSNTLKGDGLVIYDVSKIQRPQILLQNVCGQLNGSELPQGNVLKVEASRTNESIASNDITDSLQNSTIETDVEAKDMTPTKPENEGDPELDDFFDSI